MNEKELFEKAERILESCKTCEQFRIYENWRWLFVKYLNEMKIDGRDILSDLFYKEQEKRILLCISKNNI